MTRIFSLLLVIALLVRLASGYYAKRLLPPEKDLNSQIKTEEPVQTLVKDKLYRFKHYNKEYAVQPRADYEIYGLIVSHNNIHSIADMYHDKSSVDIKDLCLIWGSNAKEDIYKNVKFSSGAWTCYMEYKTAAVRSKFKFNKISNNHILARSAVVAEKIRALNVGDQVYLSGQLVDYHEVGDGGNVRKTSLARDDKDPKGSGAYACEVMMVDYVRVLKRGNVFLNKIKVFSSYLILVFALLSIFFFLNSAYRW